MDGLEQCGERCCKGSAQEKSQEPMRKRHLSAEAKAILEERKTRYPQLNKAERKEYQYRIGRAAREDWRRYVADIAKQMAEAAAQGSMT